MNICVLWYGYGFYLDKDINGQYFLIYIYYFISLGGLFISILLFFKLWELYI